MVTLKPNMLNGRAFYRCATGLATNGYVKVIVYILLGLIVCKAIFMSSSLTNCNVIQIVQPPMLEIPTVSYTVKRALSKRQNQDEFITQVLKDVQITEVNLQKIRDQFASEFDRVIKSDLEMTNSSLGADGLKSSLKDELKAQADEVFKSEGFNRLLSDYIPYDRSYRDVRHIGCLSESYDLSLPTTSVVIVFSDEAFSTLIRTVTSVFNRTPPHLLSDVILIDDYSSRNHLKGKLERYLATKFPIEKIRLARLSQRVGLIKAKMLGGHLATGDVITFLDSHCEVANYWSEPLLQRIKANSTVVACPQMDFIDANTLEITTVLFYPSFFWKGDFFWDNIPEAELKRRPHEHSPIRTPVMVGGIFAVDRKYFWKIGSYDPGMELWGGENLEIGFRIWQCGGSIEVIPCSHVGHIAKLFTPYGDKMGKWVANTARVAKVWMDEYQDIFFSFWPTLQNITFDVTSRLAFRQRNQCKGFRWYLENVHSSAFRMQFDSKFYGQIRNDESGYCLDAVDDIRFGAEYFPAMTTCIYPAPVKQVFFLSNDKRLRREYECAVYVNNRVQMYPCYYSSTILNTWEYSNTQLKHIPSGLCASLTRPNDTLVLGLEQCLSNSTAQMWTFGEKLKAST